MASVLCHQLLNCFVIFMWYHSCFYNSPWCWKKWMHWLLCPAQNRRRRNNSHTVLFCVEHWNEMLAGHRTVLGGAFISGFPWYCTSAVNWEVFSAQKTALPRDAVKPCRVLISAELRGAGPCWDGVPHVSPRTSGTPSSATCLHPGVYRLPKCSCLGNCLKPSVSCW